MDQKTLTHYFNQLDRSFFIDGPARSMAAMDTALSIGYGQTISQPSLVLAMTHLLELRSDSRTLEIGTGSGFQTALLARFSASVYTIERIAPLQADARKRLEVLGFNNIYYRCGDGSVGWPEAAPFDRIILTAAAGKMPEALIDQLALGGRMLLPLGPKGMQALTLITRDKKGKVRISSLEHVSFVEFKGIYGWQTEERPVDL